MAMVNCPMRSGFICYFRDYQKQDGRLATQGALPAGRYTCRRYAGPVPLAVIKKNTCELEIENPGNYPLFNHLQLSDLLHTY
ncbi:hypothetical protein SAMN06265375_10139 [Muriicola jejuensis]|nr:hypothetical protein SAMN06265375_10139 [Muriicola jejuensis]